MPPRSELPAWVIIEDVPGLGTTWYERGFRYWVRRAGFVLFLAALVAFIGFLTWVVVSSAGPAGSGRFAVVATVVGVYTAVTFVLTLVMLPRRALRRDTAGGRGGSEAGRAGAGLGMAAQAGNALAGVLIFIAAVATLGCWAAGLVLSCYPMLPAERAARRRLTERLRAASGS